jgi:hypothetical protein
MSIKQHNTKIVSHSISTGQLEHPPDDEDQYNPLEARFFVKLVKTFRVPHAIPPAITLDRLRSLRSICDHDKVDRFELLFTR